MGMDAGAETARREVFALALFGDIGLMRRRALDGVLPQLVGRTEGVEDEAGIGQQVLAPFLLQPERIGKDRQRIGFGEIGDGVKTLPLQQFVDLGFGGGGEAATELLQRGRRQHVAQHRAGAGMRRRIGLEDDARRPPRLLLGEIAQADAAAGAEGGGVVQHRMHLGIARHAVDVPGVEIDQRAGLAHPLLGRMQIVEEFDRERIDIQMRNAVRAAGHGRKNPLHSSTPPEVCPCHALPPRPYCWTGISQR